MQRLAPYLQRLGDLMQRESLLTSDRDRRLTNEMAILSGKALEELSRATGSVAHFYKDLQMGPQAGQFKINPSNYSAEFRQMIENLHVVVRSG
mmetsp:Transcript_29793/g.22095  ORF Transcript_29793/g.22095 Transcript_29793/m.22095 type:complete len:93 (-) Transcript_29793:1289-1567(-)